ncbi:MAG: long-chain fatty acid--CoA ligase [Actinobacteria bacterium]|nr:long-chain fatty acid--CoA ligase [Actinomycetota bacterium]
MPTMLKNPTEEQIDYSLLENRAANVGALFRDRVAKTPDAIAYWYPEGDGYAKVSWKQVKDTVYALGAGLIDLGVGEEERVAIASGTRYEWVIADLADMVSGAVTTTIYPTTIADDVAFILSDSDTKVVFAEDNAQVEKLRSIRDVIPNVAKVVVFDGEGDGDWVITMEDLEVRGRARMESEPGVVDARIDNIAPERLATIIYTSGTTGRPKGVRLLHKTWTYQGAAIQATDILGPDDLQYLWLPLAHVFGKQLLTIPLQIGFPTVVDGRIDKIVDNLAVVKPTFMGAAPRIFEKAYGRIKLMMDAESGAKAKIASWALGVGDKVATGRADGKEPSGALKIQHNLADKLVLSKVRDRFGGNIRFFISGSAALNADVARWFASTGLLIAEGYGLTESSSAAFVNRLKAYKMGTVGWPIPGLECQIAEDGEVLLRGEGIMDGYHNNPEATAEVKDDEGWFHTGDIGEIDSNGFLKITDRKKDLFKTSNGKYVAPSLIETAFKGLNPYASQIVVYGNDRHFVSALVTLDPEAIVPWAAANGLSGKSYEEIASSEQAQAMVQGYIDELNAGLNRWEQIKKFTILGSDLSIESGELTPSLKVKRKVVTEKYKKELDAHYA